MGKVGAILFIAGIAGFVLAVIAVCGPFIRKEQRRAMLTEKSGDDAPRDRADSLWLPSHFGDQPHVGNLFHSGTFTGKGR